MIVLLSQRQLGVIKRLHKKGLTNLYYCPDCHSIHNYTAADFVPYSSHSYYKCKTCGYHIWTASFAIDDILKGRVEPLNRDDMHYFSAKHRQHSAGPKPLTEKEYHERFGK